MNNLPELFRIKMVEPIRLIHRNEREKVLQDAGYNLFGVDADNIFIDLLTDSGTSAMSDRQWAALMMGDESYAGCRNYRNLERAIRDLMGFPYYVPTHQGRAAENLLFFVKLKPGDYVPNNTHFDTTRANVEVNKAHAVDLMIDEAHTVKSNHPFKGNMDIEKLANFITSTGADKIPVGMITITNNSVGGQPVSMDNIRRTAQVYKDHKIPFYIDACRYAENSYFIQQREEGYANRSIREIAREIFSYADGATMSAKKDALVNIGGFLASRDEEFMRLVHQKMVVIEGFPTYGGLSGRDMEAMVVGLYEGQDQDYLRYRVEHTAYLARKLKEAGVPVVEPVGGHAVYVDAAGFLSHIPRHLFPGQALVVELYRQGGIRAVEVGSVMFMHRDSQGEIVYPQLDLVRLAIPRRVYTRGHLEYVARVFSEIRENRESITGVEFTYEPPVLKHFTARFRQVPLMATSSKTEQKVNI